MHISFPARARRSLESRALALHRQSTDLGLPDLSRLSHTLESLIHLFIHGTLEERRQSLESMALIAHCTDPQIEPVIRGSGLFPLVLDGWQNLAFSESAVCLECICGLLCQSNAPHDIDILELLVNALPPLPLTSISGIEVEVVYHIVVSLRSFFVKEAFRDFFFERGLLPCLVRFYELDPIIDCALMLIAQDCAGSGLKHEHAVAFVKRSMEIVEPHTAEFVALLVYWKLREKPSGFASDSRRAFVLDLFGTFPAAQRLLIESFRYVDERSVSILTEEIVSERLVEMILSDSDLDETRSALRTLCRFVQVGAAKADAVIFKPRPEVLQKIIDLILEGSPFILKTHAVKAFSLILQNLPHVFDPFLTSESHGPPFLSTLFLSACRRQEGKAVEYMLIGVDRYAKHALVEELSEPFLLALSAPECVDVIHELMEAESEDIRILSEGLYLDWLEDLLEN
jgi:hypothetical protein